MKTVTNIEEMKKKNTGEIGNVQESIAESAPVLSPVCLVSVRNSSESSSSRFQVSDSKKLAGATGFHTSHVQRQKTVSWSQNGKTWSDRTEGWKSNSSQNWRWMDSCEKPSQLGERRRRKGNSIQHLWRLERIMQWWQVETQTV